MGGAGGGLAHGTAEPGAAMVGCCWSCRHRDGDGTGMEMAPSAAALSLLAWRWHLRLTQRAARRRHGAETSDPQLQAETYRKHKSKFEQRGLNQHGKCDVLHPRAFARESCSPHHFSWVTYGIKSLLFARVCWPKIGAHLPSLTPEFSPVCLRRAIQ